MIVPSIDIMKGRAVQLRRGREFVLDGGDPLKRLDEFAVAGEVAVVDLDAALGRGSNAPLIREMVRRAPCRVGGGIRDREAALDWLDAGAARLVIGTAASVEFCGALPRDRVIAAVDAERGKIVVEGWQRTTEAHPVRRIAELRGVVGGFLLTQVEREGDLGGFDRGLVAEAVGAAGDARVTAAGGITSPEGVADLDQLGADAQVGMALYSDRLTLGDAVAAILRKPVNDLWPTVVCDETGAALGLAWSSRESLTMAVHQRRGVYWSRSRDEMWVKGATSGATQALQRVDVDCDRDALRFTVEQTNGFCHQGARSCWGDDFGLRGLEQTIAQRLANPLPGSGTAALDSDETLLRSKLVEEAAELAGAATAPEAIHEAADVLYVALVALARRGGTLPQVVDELRHRHLRERRRPMRIKSGSP